MYSRLLAEKDTLLFTTATNPLWLSVKVVQVKQQMYHCNVVYGTTSEFGFDFLRDNMKLRAEEQVQL